MARPPPPSHPLTPTPKRPPALFHLLVIVQVSNSNCLAKQSRVVIIVLSQGPPLPRTVQFTIERYYTFWQLNLIIVASHLDNVLIIGVIRACLWHKDVIKQSGVIRVRQELVLNGCVKCHMGVSGASVIERVRCHMSVSGAGVIQCLDVIRGVGVIRTCYVSYGCGMAHCVVYNCTPPLTLTTITTLPR